MVPAFAILTPIPVEFDAVCEKLQDQQEPDQCILPTRLGRIGKHAVVCVLSGKGEGRTATALQHVLGRWKPRWVLLVGVAGGFPEHGTKRGEVVISSFVYGYGFGKVEQGRYIRRPEYDFQPDRSLLAYAELTANRENQGWKEQIGMARPDEKTSAVTKAHVGYIASGDLVIDDPDYKFFQDVRSILPEIHAVEMEAAGAGAAIALEQAQRAIGFLMIRGISDEPSDASGRNGIPGSEQRQSWKPYAAAAAAAFVEAFLSEFPRDQTSADSSRNRAEPKPGKSPADVLSKNVYEKVPSAGNPATLLNARYQVVPFFPDPRDKELNELEQWCADSTAAGVRLFVGPGGSGKTRLFIEWARRVREQGWSAGFVREELSKEDTEVLLTSAKPCLAVIDYAESRPWLGDFLLRVAQRSSNRSGPLRVALLARDVADWWGMLRQSDDAIRHVLDAYSPTRLEMVPVEGPLRREVWKQAASAFADRLGKPRPAVAPDLTDPLFGRPLYLHMAALAAVEGLDITAQKLLGAIVTHETHFWLKQFQKQTAPTNLRSADFLRRSSRMVAAVTLRGGLSSVEEGEDLNTRVAGPEEPLFVQFLRSLYPGSPGTPRALYVAPLEPDLLGEALIVDVLQDANTPAKYLEQVFDKADDSALRSGFTILSRLSIRRPQEGAEWVRRVLDPDVQGRSRAALDACLAVCSESAAAATGNVLAKALERQGTHEIAKDFDERIPEETVSLREVALWATAKLLEKLSADSANESTRVERARLLNNLGNRLSDLGRREDALTAAQEATDISRELANRRPDAFLPDLATSLNNLGKMLSDLGRREDALTAAQEATDIYRGLAKTRPDAFLPYLAVSLNNLGNRLSRLGRREDALKAGQEAVAIRRRLAKDCPDAFLPDLATSLNNLGNGLSDLGRREDALAAAEEATEIYRGLANYRPDAFLPRLATSFNNLGNRLGDLGRREDALTAAEEATKIYRGLAKNRPDAFLPYLAGGLNNLGNRLSYLGRCEDALTAAEEATEIRRRLAKTRPDVFLPHLAESLNNLGTMLSDLGRRGEALKAAQEATAIYRDLAKDRPVAFLPDLATSLNNLGNRLSDLGRREEALKVAEEAMTIRRCLAKDQPDAFLADLAMSLNNLGKILSDLGRRQEALKATEEASEIYRELAKDRPDAFLSGLARSLGTLGACLRAESRLKDAVAALSEGIKTLAPAFTAHPASFGRLMAALVKNYLQVSQEVDSEPDLDLLGPILEKLAAMKKDDARSGP